MHWINWTLAAIGIGLGVTLAFAVVRFNLKRLRVMRDASSATSPQLEEIYQLVDALAGDSARGYVLGRLNEIVEDASCIVTVPAGLKEFPWAGRSIAVEVGDDVHFRFLDKAESGTQLLSRKYRLVAVPQVTLQSGKTRNQFAPKRYLKGNPELQKKLSLVCPKYPEGLLSYLLCAGNESFEFEPMDQGRIGTSAEWVQDPEFQHCPQCKKRMRLILQLPGKLFDKKAFHRGTFYLFGCEKHPENTAIVNQFT